MSTLTETGTLPIGIVVDGVRHTTFELRPVTVGDNVDAVEQLDAKASAYRFSVVLFARQLVALGTIPKEQITAELVQALAPSDFNVLEEANEVLKKKQVEFGMPWSGGIKSASSATATA